MNDVISLIFRYVYHDVMKQLLNVTKEIVNGGAEIIKCSICENWTENDKCEPFEGTWCWGCCNHWIESFK